MKNDELISDRLKEARQFKGYTQEQMSNVLDCHLRSWQEYENGNSLPGGKILANLANEGFNINWILTGEGYITHAEGKSVFGPKLDHEIFESKPEPKGEYTQINVFSNPTKCDNEKTIDYLPLKTSWIKDNLKLPPENLFLLYIDGDRMEPTLKSGDYVIFKAARGVKNIENGIYVFMINRKLIALRVHVSKNGDIEACSDNYEYQSFYFDIEKQTPEMCLIGRVVASMQLRKNLNAV